MRNNSINTFRDFLTSFNRYRKKRRIVKDEKKLRGAVDKSSSEQHFRRLDTITFVVWSHTPSASGSYGSLAGRQLSRLADRQAVRRNKARFEKFWNPLLIALLGILRRFMKVQCYCSVTNAFQLFFSGKAYCEACCGDVKKWDTMFFRVDPYY